MIRLFGLTNDFELLPVRTVRAIERADVIFLQSGKAGCAQEICRTAQDVRTLDDIFEAAEDFGQLYVAGAARMMECAGKEVLFGVIGDMDSNGFVIELRRQGETEVLSWVDEASEALMKARVYFKIDSYTIVDARALTGKHIHTADALVVCGIDDRFTAGDTRLSLGEYYNENTKAVLVCGGKVQLIAVQEISGIQEFGTGCCVVLPGMELQQKERYDFYDLTNVMKVLRGKNGCPWDAEQTHKTLRQYILEEAYEVLDAIDADDMNALYDELGDVLLQIVFHAEIARQCGEFNDMDVTTAISSKMISRHTHIFGDGKADTPDEVVKSWEAIKREEKGNETFVSVLRDVPKTMGAMMRSYKLQKKAGAIGFDWENADDAFDKVLEEVQELKEELQSGTEDDIEGEAGDLLFAVINVLRKKRINPEVALTRTCEKFITRFSYMEENAKGRLFDLSLKEMDVLWNNAKNHETKNVL